MQLYYKDKEYSFQLLRTMGQTSVGAADIGECLKTAYRIREGGDESWYREWYALAESLIGAATNDLAGGFTQSAREAYARASTYYRAAGSFLSTLPPDERIVDSWQRSREAFLRYSRTLDFPVRPVEIPYDHVSVSGYYCMSDASRTRRPLVIIQGDFDSTSEELFFTYGLAALNRCYNCLIFEGPGYGRMLRVHNVNFRHDWEVVAGPVIDFALKQPESDAAQIIMMGIGMGGHLAARACAYDQRVAACVINGGFLDLQELILRSFPAGSGQKLDNPLETRALDQLINIQVETSRSARHFFNDLMWRFGASTGSDFLRKCREFSLRDSIGRLQCRTLVADSEGDQLVAGLPHALFEALAAPKQFMAFSAEDGAEEHAQTGAAMIANERIFNWLDMVVKTPAASTKAESTYWG